jgi:putative DeoR family transcriptional regulator (stage III sporulation protein D)
LPSLQTHLLYGVFSQFTLAQSFISNFPHIIYKSKIGSDVLKSQTNDRAIILGEFILENKSTVRAAARRFGISKSTVHKDVSERLPKISPQLSILVKEVLEQNKQERHIRGGLATKEKYRQLAETKMG